jgi:hypothetical protein
MIVFLTPHLGAAPAGMIAVVSRLWTTGVELIPAGIFWVGWLRGRQSAGPDAAESETSPVEGR